jgi:hypothetical protein
MIKKVSPVPFKPYDSIHEDHLEILPSYFIFSTPKLIVALLSHRKDAEER